MINQIKQIQKDLERLNYDEMLALALALITEFYLSQWTEQKNILIPNIKKLRKENEDGNSGS